MNKRLAWSDYSQWLKDNLIKLPETQEAPLPHSFCIDSRLVGKDQWFVAIKGTRVDGHDYIESALDNGASGIIVEKESLPKLSARALKKALVLLDNVKGLGQIAGGYRSLYQDITLVALTGSVGKTTTKEMLAHILQNMGEVLFSQGNFNNELGLPLTLFKLKPTHKFVVLEMGARKPGDIKQLLPIAQPNITIFLNAKESHLEIFRTREALFATKTEIIYASKPDCKIACTSDDSRLDIVSLRKDRKVCSFGTKTADVTLGQVTWQADSIHFDLSYQGKLASFHIPKAHSAYPINWAAATAAAILAGTNFESLPLLASSFIGTNRRFQTYEVGPLTLIDDAYNASPTSMLAGFETLKARFGETAKQLVLGDMLEIGDDWPMQHEKIGRLCQEILAPTLLITIGERAKWMQKAAIAAGLAPERTAHFTSVLNLIEQRQTALPKSGLLYLKGSNAMQLGKLVDNLLTEK